MARYAQLTVLFNRREIGSVGSGGDDRPARDQHDFVFSCATHQCQGGREDRRTVARRGRHGDDDDGVKDVRRTPARHRRPARNALIELAYQLQQTRRGEGIPGAQLNWTTAQSGHRAQPDPGEATAGAESA